MNHTGLVAHTDQLVQLQHFATLTLHHVNPWLPMHHLCFALSRLHLVRHLLQCPEDHHP